MLMAQCEHIHTHTHVHMQPDLISSYKKGCRGESIIRDQRTEVKKRQAEGQKKEKMHTTTLALIISLMDMVISFTGHAFPCL